MANIPRKSILNIQNIELDPLKSPAFQISMATSRSTPSITYLTPSPNSKAIPRKSLQVKMQRLNDMKLTSLFEKDIAVLTGFRNAPKSNICISELWGSKETYLRRTGYLEAYNELKKQNAIEKIKETKTARKVKAPHIEDMNSKIKVMKDFQRNSVNEEKKLLPIIEVAEKKFQGKKDSIDTIIQKCSELSKKSHLLKKQTEQMRLAFDTYAKKKNKVGAKLAGLSQSTSEELLRKKYEILKLS
ncbi:hypothetical protein SteCoe_27955 [Stentor coeruleus]|uniref:Uncharacterized protein n=1 Tax=Stentor coeruleus TaxID=5963 RepID=A0A1R2B9C4_9CILI|nr:hypothetical protein SteCoe_27955 [Stentor coeruleus]